jgi:hypothetical protein
MIALHDIAALRVAAEVSERLDLDFPEDRHRTAGRSASSACTRREVQSFSPLLASARNATAESPALRDPRCWRRIIVGQTRLQHSYCLIAQTNALEDCAK